MHINKSEKLVNRKANSFSTGHNGGPDRWIKLWESTFDHWLVGRHNPEYFTAWQDLLMQCRYADGYIMAAGRKMMLKRGSLLGAVSFLADRWNWTPKRVRVFLNKLEADGMIKTHANGTQKGKSKGRFPNTISVCNYERYQNPDAVLGQDVGQIEGQVRGELRASSGPVKGEKYKKGKKDKKEDITQQRVRETPLPDFSYGADDFQLDAKGKLMLVNGERSDWLDCFGGSEDALKIALKGFTPNLEYKGSNTLAKHARHYLNQQAQAFNRNAKNAAPAKRARISARARQRLSDSNKGGVQ